MVYRGLNHVSLAELSSFLGESIFVKSKIQNHQGRIEYIFDPSLLISLFYHFQYKKIDVFTIIFKVSNIQMHHQ